MPSDDRDPRTVDIHGKTFGATGNSEGGEVDPATRFRYHQEGHTVWADYAGGAIARGYLVGTRTGDRLDFRYVHLNSTGTTAAGRCTSRITVLDDGRVRMEEEWTWESRPGSGRSAVEQDESGDGDPFTARPSR
ncbi:hypothetical protein [Blastococcus montanus]|uniref:hypothetical protein n=1 Tax=Blastococcus montanus TaxID=3144973 RepID=UPI003209B39A